MGITKSSSLVGWYVVFILFIAGLVSVLDRQIINLLVDPIKTDLGITDTQISLLQGLSFAFFYAVFALPMGVLADVWSRVRVIVGGMILWSVATIFCGLSNSFASLFVARMFVGIGEAGLGPAGSALIADKFPPEKVGRAISIIGSVGYVGIGMSIVFGGFIVTKAETLRSVGFGLFAQMSAWQIAFVVCGLPGIVLALIVLATLRDTSTSQSEQSIGSNVTFSETRKAFREAISYVWTHRRGYAAIFFTTPIAAALQYGLASWIPATLERKFGWEPTEIGLKYGLVSASCGFLGAITGGLATDALRKRNRHDANVLVGLVSVSVSLPFILIFALADTDIYSVPALMMMAFFGSMYFGPGLAAIATVSPRQSRAQIVALYLMVGTVVGLSLGPWLIAFLTDTVYENAARVGESIAVVAVLLSVMCLAILTRGRKAFAAFSRQSETLFQVSKSTV